MKKLILLGFLTMFLTTGCATQGKISREEWDKKIEQAKNEQEVENKRATYLANLKPGLTLAEIKQNGGEPDSSEFINGQYFIEYRKLERPVILAFDKDEKLTSWMVDRDLIAKREKDFQNEQQKQEILAEHEMQRQRALGQALSNFGQGMARSHEQVYQQQKAQPLQQIHCSSMTLGNSTETNCH